MELIVVTQDGGVIDVSYTTKTATLEQLQLHVGGMVEAIYLDRDTTMWANENGKFDGSKLNYIATKVWEAKYGKTDRIYGNVVFSGGATKAGNTLGLSSKTLSVLRPVLEAGEEVVKLLRDIAGLRAEA